MVGEERGGARVKEKPPLIPAIRVRRKWIGMEYATY